MRPMRRLLSLGKKPVFKPAAIEPLRLLHRLGATTVRATHFQIVLEGEWTRAENPHRAELRDQNGMQQLFITEYAIDPRDFKQIQQAVAHFAALKLQGLQKLGPHVQIFAADDLRIDRQQVEARLEAHDTKQQVAIATLIRADKSMLLELTIYHYGLPAPDANQRAEINAMFDLLHFHDADNQSA